MYNICKLQVTYCDARFWGCVEQKVTVSKAQGARTVRERALRGTLCPTESDVCEAVWCWRAEAS